MFKTIYYPIIIIHSINQNMRKSKIAIAVTLVSLGLGACTDKGVFDTTVYPESVKNAFPVDHVDVNQKWQTVGTLAIHTVIQLENGETYKVKVYQENPLSNKRATLLASDQVVNGGTFTANVSRVLADSAIYFALFDSKDKMSVYVKDIGGETLNTTIGPGSTKAKATKATARTISGNYAFAQAPADADFATAIPAGAKDISTYKYTTSGENNYYVSESTTRISASSGYCNLYFGPGNYTLSSLAVGTRSNIYLLPGAKVNLTEGLSSITNYETKMFIAKGASVSTTNSRGVLYDFQLYNRGDIATTKLDVNASKQGLCYNEGTITASDFVMLRYSDTQIVNEGSISTREWWMTMGHFLNTGEVNVTGKTTFTKDDYYYPMTWRNDGTYTTHDFSNASVSNDIINNCKLTVNNNLSITSSWSMGQFRVDGGTPSGACVVTKNLSMDDACIVLGAKALFQVTGTATFSKNERGFISYADETERPLLLFGKAEAKNKRQRNTITYNGNMMIGCDDHFDKENDYEGTDGWYRLINKANGAIIANSTTATTETIEATSCNVGHSDGTVTPPEDKGMTLRYCYEDNFPQPGDYDFNDVVLSITPTVVGTKQIKLLVSLDAVGAAKQLAGALRLSGIKTSHITNISVDGAWFDLNKNHSSSAKMIQDGNILMKAGTTDDAVLYLFNDAHWCMQNASGDGVQRVFYNTVKGSSSTVTPTVYTITITFQDASDVKKLSSSTLDPFIVESQNGSYWEVHTNPFKKDRVLYNYDNNGFDFAFDSNYPWAVCMPGDFRYPCEYKPIGTLKDQVIGGAYRTEGHSFAEWAKDKNAAVDWYKYPDENSVY